MDDDLCVYSSVHQYCRVGELAAASSLLPSTFRPTSWWSMLGIGSVLPGQGLLEYIALGTFVGA